MALDARVGRIMLYFEPDVLAAYHTQPNKYTVKTDHFEGEVTLAAPYCASLDDEGRERESIDVGFGYRTLKNGDLKIAAFGPDLVSKSAGHVARWQPFLIQEAEWLPLDQDERFSLWVRRYLKGDWDVPNGPASDLLDEVRYINGLTSEAVGRRLFDVDDPAIGFPAAQNTHRYQDAHRELYGLLVDGLDKSTIALLGNAVGRPFSTGHERTLRALHILLPALNANAEFTRALDIVSEQRRLASHRVRPPAQSMRAFEEFTRDLNACVDALRLLRAELEASLRMDAERSTKRQDALGRLPAIAKPPLLHFSVNAAREMVGKTVEKVEVGWRAYVNDRVHQSECIVVHFADGSIMAIDTCSNAWNLSEDSAGAMKPDDFHVGFNVNWVPPR